MKYSHRMEKTKTKKEELYLCPPPPKKKELYLCSPREAPGVPLEGRAPSLRITVLGNYNTFQQKLNLLIRKKNDHGNVHTFLLLSF